MKRERIPLLAGVLTGLLLAGCDSWDGQGDHKKTYEASVVEAGQIKDRAEKLYLDAMSYESATEERNSLLRKAYDEGEKAMDIFNRLDEQYGDRIVP